MTRQHILAINLPTKEPPSVAQKLLTEYAPHATDSPKNTVELTISTTISDAKMEKKIFMFLLLSFSNAQIIACTARYVANMLERYDKKESITASV